MTIDRFDEAAEENLFPTLVDDFFGTDDLPTDEMLVNWREAAEYDHEGDFEFDGSWEDDA